MLVRCRLRLTGWWWCGRGREGYSRVGDGRCEYQRAQCVWGCCLEDCVIGLFFCRKHSIAVGLLPCLCCW
jgi:hypothetical protein